ncbi:sigma-70 family RNA polymerase sigma factor [Blastopirellula sp. J2-11]|uniref:sigma-70 family RNA polymerase sigma factor n=1 Tax=Blastopirellula sp. J2-11 TaxID=2943192 RepID=UPI0021C6B9C5|nr:sigma-70 family RNA polymerase sigma factor [Blastopirellula sp. J2-11]UUO05776.1 sigma-70 family RNA polymerase sigma factor [Blastopirellula sp. J2-11]
MLMNDPSRHQQFLREFTCHEPAVRAFVRRLVPSRSDADDILQEVSIVLWEKFDSFRAEEDFRAWACGIARYKVLSWLRDKGREKLVLASDVVELIADDSLAAESHLKQQREALETCFEKIPMTERNLLSQAYQADVKIQEVAAASGRSVAGFYQWLYRMRRMLLECIQRQHAQDSW